MEAKEITYGNGDVYVGKLVGGRREYYIYIDDEVYEGEFKAGLPDGHGKYTTAVSIYEGEWNAAKEKGYGTLTRINIAGDNVSDSYWTTTKAEAEVAIKEKDKLPKAPQGKMLQARSGYYHS